MREKESGAREVFESAISAKHIAISIYLELGHTEAIKRTWSGIRRSDNARRVSVSLSDKTLSATDVRRVTTLWCDPSDKHETNQY
jgi:hypothetical protein